MSDTEDTELGLVGEFESDSDSSVGDNEDDLSSAEPSLLDEDIAAKEL